MNTTERIQSIIAQMKARHVTIQDLITASGYQGVWHALYGTSIPSAENLDKMEAGMKLLEGKDNGT